MPAIDVDVYGAALLKKDDCVNVLHQSDIAELLVNWLNEEVRDHLISIDEKLGELLETRGPPRKSHIRKSLFSTAKQSVCDDGLGLRISSTSELSAAFEPTPTRISASQQSVSSSWRNKLVGLERTIQFHQNAHGRYKATIWRFLEDRSSSLAAYAWSFVIPSIVFLSLALSFWQSVDGCPLRGASGEIMHLVFEAVFVVELLLRFYVCPDRILFWRNLFNVIDLLTCAPLVFRLSVAILGTMGKTLSADDVLSTLAFLPVLRFLKLARRFEKFQLLLSAYLLALEALPVLLYTMLVIAFIFSGLIYAVEPRENIPSLPNAIWFIIVTMTTCGYGDVTPSTILGHIITSILMIISTLYMAIPIGIVGNAFSQAWEARDRLLLMARIREVFLHHGFSETAFKDIVRFFAADDDGELGFDEFQAMLHTMNINIGAGRVQMLLDSLDQDGSGRVSVDELLSGLFPSDYAEYFSHLKVEPSTSCTATSTFQPASTNQFTGSSSLSHFQAGQASASLGQMRTSVTMPI